MNPCPHLATTLDHLSFGTHNITKTRVFYEGKLGFPVLIHERMLMQKGGTVEHIFFACGGDCALAFLQWQAVPGEPSDYDSGFNHGLGVPKALEAHRQELVSAGVVLRELLDLDPYRSFFFDEPVNGLRPIAIPINASSPPAWPCLKTPRGRGRWWGRAAAGHQALRCR